MNNKSVTVYCASSPDAPERFIDAAHRLGRLAAEAGWATVTGAGTLGLMGAVVKGSLSVSGGRAIGVIPRFMVERGWANPSMSELHITDTMAERKQMLARLGRGAIALPGGIGTLDELMDILAQCQLGLYRHPVVILNIDGFYDNLLAQLHHADSCAMMRHIDRSDNLWIEARTPAEALDAVINNQ